MVISPPKPHQKNSIELDEDFPFTLDPKSFPPLAMVMYVEPQPTAININLNISTEAVEEQQTAPQEPSQTNPLDLNKMAPHLRNVKRKMPPKKAKYFPIPSTRKSKRLRSVMCTKKTNSVDETVYEIHDSEGESEPTTPVIEKTSSPLKSKPKADKKVSKPSVKASVPKPKPKQTVKDKGKQKQTAQLERSSESSPDEDEELTSDYSPECSPKRKKASKPKNISIYHGKKIPLFDPTLKKEFKEKWINRSIVVGRYYDFVKLENDKVVFKEYVDEQG